ncbi:MAG: ribonuclease III, partial [Prevotella sp.]|nr:ribonuclease III [Prevotella sp.]
KDDKGSPIFGFQVFIEGVEGGKAQGYSKKEAQQLSSKETLERLRREPQFIDSIFAAKSERTKMEEEPTMAAPNIETLSEAPIFPDNPVIPESPEIPETPEAPAAQSAPPDDEFDLSDITHNPKELSREEIIAAAEEAAFAES